MPAAEDCGQIRLYLAGLRLIVVRKQTGVSAAGSQQIRLTAEPRLQRLVRL